MIFRNTLFGVAVCLAGVLTACAEKELTVVEPVDDGSQVEICFAPTIGADISTKGSDVQPIGETGLYLRTIVSENKTNPFEEVATRATLVDGFSPDGAEGTYSTFTVYSFLHEGSWAENCEDATPYINGIDAVSLGNGYWGFEESVFWPAWDTNMTFLAYAAPEDSDVDISFTEDDGDGGYVYVAPTLVYSDPAVAELDKDGAITDDGLAAQYDLLVAQTPDLTKETTTIPMTFSHVFTSVQFICGNMTGGTISKLSLVNIAHEGVYDFGTNTWEVDTDNRTEYVFPLTVTVPETENDVDLDAGDTMDSYGTNILGGSSALMMVPQDLTGCALLLEYTPTDDTEPMELAVELHGEWEAGAHITYHISFLAGDDDILPYLTGTDGFFAAYALANFDTDKNGHVSQAEADVVTEIICGYYTDLDQTPSSRIDFAGIECFTNLERFTSNYASALDLTQNLKLNYIKFNSENSHAPNVSNLDLSKNTKLTKIPDNAFRSNTALRTVTLPDTVEEIGWAAFNGVTGNAVSNGFNGLTLPSSLKKIGGHAFYGCTYITAMDIPESVTEMGSAVFYNCTNLASDIKLTNVTEIQDSTFMSCSKVTGITLSENITGKIGVKAFYGCSGVTSAIKLPEGITEVCDWAFRGCTSIPTISLPETLVSVGEYAFYSCKAEFTVPEKFTTTEIDDDTTAIIGQYAFYDCTGLKTYPIPDFVTEIGQYAFRGCTSLTDISAIPSKLTTSIGNYTFYSCEALTTDIVIPEGVTEIGSNSFYGCSALTLVDLPSTITSLGTYAFNNCTGLETMIERAVTVPSVSTRSVTFNSTGTAPVLYVPDESISAYSSSSWKSQNGFSAIKGLSDLATDFPGEYDEDGNRL